MNTTTFSRHVSSLYVCIAVSVLIHTLLLFVPFAFFVQHQTIEPQRRLIPVELLIPEPKTEKKNSTQQNRGPALLKPEPDHAPVKKTPAPVPKGPTREYAREASVSLDRLSQNDMQYRSYIGHLRSKIGSVWEQSSTARDKSINGVVTVRFSIAKDGSLQALNIQKNSPHQLLDNEAVRIIKTAAPFYPFPLEFSIETLHVTASFEYEFNEGY